MNSKLQKHFGTKPIIWVAAWGISKLRKRAGKFAGGIEGEARWYDQWYDRVMSEETVDQLAGLGVNLVVLPFSLGGQAHTEQAERDDFERVTRLLHARGMVSLPYLQYQNILQETFSFSDTTWSVSLDGGRKEFSYWRRTVCQSSAPFLAYFKDLISDAVGRGADCAVCAWRRSNPGARQCGNLHRKNADPGGVRPPAGDRGQPVSTLRRDDLPSLWRRAKRLSASWRAFQDSGQPHHAPRSPPVFSVLVS